MNRWLAHATWGLGALGLLVLAPGSAQAQEASANAAPEARVIHPALYPDIVELIVPGGSFLVMVQEKPAEESLAAFIVERSSIQGEMTPERLRRLQQQPDRFELRIRNARVVLLDSAGPDRPSHYGLRPVSASPVEVEVVLQASMKPKDAEGDAAATQPSRKLRWLQLDGSATFAWTNGAELRLHRAHATLASIPDEGFQAPRLLLVEPLRDSLAAR
jgi:hypothetical protein